MKVGEFFLKLFDFIFNERKTPAEWILRFSLSPNYGMLKSIKAPLFYNDICPRCKQEPAFCCGTLYDNSLRIYKRKANLIFGQCCRCGHTAILYDLKSIVWDRPSMDTISEHNLEVKLNDYPDIYVLKQGIYDDRFCKKCGGIYRGVSGHIDPGKTVYYCECKSRPCKDAGGERE